MASTPIASFTDGATADATDRIAAVRSPFGSGDDRYLTPAYIGTYLSKNTLAAGTLTDSAPMTLTQTWSDAADTFTGLKVNITDTNSASASLLMDLQVGSSSKFTLQKDGTARLYNASSNIYIKSYHNGGGCFSANNFFGVDQGHLGVLTPSNWFLGFTDVSNTVEGAGSDLRLYKDAADIFAQRRGTNAQTFRVYETFTDTSNYERASLSCASNVVTLAAETAGTGADDMDVALTPAGTGVVKTAASLQAVTGTTITAGGVAGKGILLYGSTVFGIYAGSTAPTIAAGQGSLYLRTDGESSLTRAYINLAGTTTWAALLTTA